MTTKVNSSCKAFRSVAVSRINAMFALSDKERESKDYGPAFEFAKRKAVELLETYIEHIKNVTLEEFTKVQRL